MNTILLKGSDLEINAYLDSLSLHQSFEEDDTEDDEIFTVNPSGSVLQPASNPYNKQKKIAEANETLFAEEVTPKSPQRVKFNKVEKRICYDYFGSSFESDSIKSYEDEESERESLLHTNAKNKGEPILDIKGNTLQPQNPANKVIVTVSPRQPEEQENSESESEDVCVGTLPNTQDPDEITDTGTEADTAIEEKNEDNTHEADKENKTTNLEERNEYSMDKNLRTKHSDVNENKVNNSLGGLDTLETKNKAMEKAENNIFQLPVDLERHSQKYSSSFKDNTDFYPCLTNHSGITIRITGADSIESVESESTDNEVQILENYNYHNTVEFKQEGDFTLARIKHQNYKTKETTYKVSKQTFILKGTKTTQNVRVPKQSKIIETATFHRTCSKKRGGSERGLNKTKQTFETEKTEQSLSTKVDKRSSKTKTTAEDGSLKSKVLEDKSNSKTEEYFSRKKKARPKSCVEKESARVKTSTRPVTAPAKRSCCQWGQPHLPEYNGLRSEYGLSAEQLLERKRHRTEAQKVQKQRREQKWIEEQQKKKDNEATFIAWLEDKRKQAHMQFIRNQKIQAESGIKIYPAPTAHLKRTGAVRSRKLFKSQRKCVSLEELLSNASAHEKKTYRIYLGLSFE